MAGLIEGWIAVGLTLGAYLNWLIVAPRLRAYTEVAGNSITIPSFFENRLKDSTRMLRVVSGAIILVFFVFYVNSMMVAGGVFFESAFGTSYTTGLLLVAGVTMAYTLIGGFLGASLTDVVQGLLMMAALVVVPVMVIVYLGGIGPTIDAINAVDPTRLSPFGGEGLNGLTVLAIVSALAWGLGYFGQPHIIIRFMAMRDAASAKPARRIGIGWMAISLIGAVVTGLVGLAYFNQESVELSDPETVTLALSQIFFHPLIGGFVLSAVLAAIMSTISSQLVVSSSALVEDLYRTFTTRTPSQKLLLRMGQLSVFGVSVVALLLSLNPSDTILSLVAFAWAGFGAAFGPAILLALFWRGLTTWGVLSGMVVGAAGVFLWDAFGPDEVYEIIPGFLAHVIVAVVVSKLTATPNAEIEREFDDAAELAARKVQRAKAQ
jgi:sodium/proline symporter